MTKEKMFKNFVVWMHQTGNGDLVRRFLSDAAMGIDTDEEYDAVITAYAEAEERAAKTMKQVKEVPSNREKYTILNSWKLTVDEEGRLKIPASVLEGMKTAGKRDFTEGEFAEAVLIGRASAFGHIEVVPVSLVSLSKPDGCYDQVTVNLLERDGSVVFGASSVFEPGSQVMLELYSDGRALILNA